MLVFRNTLRLAPATAMVLLLSAHTRGDAGSSEKTELTAQIQKSIAVRYRDRIASRIPLESFQVSARVSILPSGTETPSPNLPASAVLTPTRESSKSNHSLLGAAALITAKPNSLAQVPAGTRATDTRDRAMVTNIEISVQLSPRFGNDYKARFEKWLRATALSEFGGVAGVRVLDSIVTASIQDSASLGGNATSEQLFIGLALPVLLLILGAQLADQRTLRVGSRERQ